ncbi:MULTISPECIES: adenosylcobinamide amidohydrolase [unclassified Streptomyces]|uniref:adenosylcobinamide amidohydrolase n=1 Tax=unclassified Streptomyces TaxID=2593676 RepID=UPI000FD98097|nr:MULTISPECIES: adenosylcobinamide amidohydrolase [unclassified Streptomyces]UQA32576.1 adenosylcobinamide amidohydrolase [Streptomyces sp. HNA39]
MIGGARRPREDGSEPVPPSHQGCAIDSVRVHLPGRCAEPRSGPRAELRDRREDGHHLHHLVWRLGPGVRVCSSAVLGGGIGPRAWILNAQVPGGYPRLDPDRHLAEIAAAEGLTGPGVGLMTAAEVAAYTTGHDGGVTATVTTGLGVRGWAAAPETTVPETAAPEFAADKTVTPETGAPETEDPATRIRTPPRPGTVNIVVGLPVALSDAALVNAVATATEAKVQALLDAGLDCSGTPTDAVCIAAPEPGPDGGEPFAGPRSPWGARIARAVHTAVLAGARPARDLS